MRYSAEDDELEPAKVSPLMMAELLRESLTRGKQPLLTVTSNSMAPLFYRGDRISVEEVQIDALQPGDVIVYASSDSLISHRYWHSANDAGSIRFLTKGDRQLCYDTAWPAKQLVGRVVSRRRGHKRLSLTSGYGRWLNRQLARLAAFEMSWLGAAAGERGSSLGFGERVVRRLAYSAAAVLTTAATLLATVEGSR
jgi:hypothetical protein